MMNAKLPLILKGNFRPGFRIGLHIKDLQNAIDTGHEVGASLLLTAQIMEVMQILKSDGKSNDDHCGVIQYYEKLASMQVRK